MLKRLTILLIFAAVLEFVAGAQTPAPGKATLPPAKQEDDPPPAMAVPESYRFQSRGRRDPFVNPVPKPAVTQDREQGPRPPGLRGVLLAEATVTAVVVSKQAPELTRAAITSAQNKTYFARKGDALFDAVVKDIQKDAVVFELASKDKDGTTTTRDVVRKIRSTP
jgi:hypothetical protein